MGANCTFKEWACSNYACDRSIFTYHSEKGFNIEKQVSEEKKSEAEKTSIKIGLLDIPSQLAKATIELVIWPVSIVGFIVYDIISIPVQLYKGRFKADEAIMMPLIGLIYAPTSAMNRIRLIGIDLFGSLSVMSRETAALNRAEAFNSFFCHGQSLLRYIRNTIKGDPYNIEGHVGKEAKF